MIESESPQKPEIISDNEKIILLLAFNVEDLIIKKHEIESSSYFRKNSKENNSFIFESENKKMAEINFQILNQSNHEIYYRLFNFSQEEKGNLEEFEGKLKEFLFLEEGESQEENIYSNTLLLKIKIPLKDYFKLILKYSEIKDAYQINDSIVKSFENKKESFENKFNQVFPISENIKKYEKCNQASFSNLMGGITYMYGGILVADKKERTEELVS